LAKRRDFESEFEQDEGGLRAGDMTSVLKMEPYTKEISSTPLMYVTDRPLFFEDRDTREKKFVYGVHQLGSSRNTAVLSSFGFQEMSSELHDQMLDTLTYHEGGYLLANDGETTPGEQCTYPDVMSGEGLWENTRNRHENQIYCEDCTREIRSGVRELEDTT
jgi:hypothetical protein